MRLVWQVAALVVITAAPLGGVSGAGPRVPAAAVVRLQPAPDLGSPVVVTVNGAPIPVAGRVEHGVALAAVDALIPALGGSIVALPGSTADVHIVLAGHVLSAAASQPTLEVDGRSQALPLAPRMIGGRLYLPVAAVVATAKDTFSWPSPLQPVRISTRPVARASLIAGGPALVAADQRPGEAASPPVAPAPAPSAPAHPAAPSPPPASSASGPGPVAAATKPVIPYTQADLELMGRVIHGEADDEPFAAQEGVAAVIVNRVRSPRFAASTIEAVIDSPGQFDAVGAPLFEAGAAAVDLKAAVAALNGADPTGGALFFYSPSSTPADSWIRTRPTLCTIGDIRFAAA